MIVKNKDIFNEACLARAKDIWWSVRQTQVPASMLGDITKTEEEYMSLMNEREAALVDAQTAIQYLQVMALGFKETNTEEQLKSACNIIKEVGSEALTSINALSEKIRKLKYTTEEPKTTW